MAVKYFLLALLIQSTKANAGSWIYKNTNNPAVWVQPSCNGTKQSPIDLITANAKVNKTLGMFTPSLFSKAPSKMLVLNTGHSVKVDFKDGPQINNQALLPDRYQAVQMHFHWALQNSTYGSEHQLNGKKFFGELHVVYVNEQHRPSPTNATDGYAVMAFFIKGGAVKDNAGFQKILDQKMSAKYDIGPKEIPSFPITLLLPGTMKSYYRYRGSFTTPGCFQVVVWTVFHQPIVISDKQMYAWQSSFRRNDTGGLMGNNFRPVQPLNGRTVYMPFTGHASGLHVSAIMLLVSIIALLVLEN